MSANFNFTWPSGPNEVILTGTFDDWKKTLPLVKQADGSFALVVPLDPTKGKILYKYVVDGEWAVSPTDRKETGSDGVENNILEPADLITATSGVPGLWIPESGGLVLAIPVVDGTQPFNATVMPKESQKATVAGEPGIQIPTDPEALAAFANEEPSRPTQVESVDRSAAALSKEEKEKQKKKVKRTKYKAKKKAAAAVTGMAPTPSSSGVDDNASETDSKDQENTGVDAKDAGVVAVVEDTIEDAPPAAMEKDAVSATEAKSIAVVATDASPSAVVEGSEKDAASETGKPDARFEAAGAVAMGVAPVAASSKATNEANPDTQFEYTNVETTDVGAGVIPPKQAAADAAEIAATGREVETTDIGAGVVPPKQAAADAAEIAATGREVETTDIGAGVIPPKQAAADAAEIAATGHAEHKTLDPSAHESNVIGVIGVPEPATEEIIIAQGGDKDEIARAVNAASAEPVQLEEIKPDQAEAERLTREANDALAAEARSEHEHKHEAEPVVAAAAAPVANPEATTPSNTLEKPKAKPASEEKKDAPKKKSHRISKFFKKIF